MEFTQPVYVKREDPDSRQNTIREIKKRAATGGMWPQIIIFPEGTCTNRSCLISFKPGWSLFLCYFLLFLSTNHPLHVIYLSLMPSLDKYKLQPQKPVLV